jgi:N-methylhydantoinase A
MKPVALAHRVAVDIGGTFTDLAWYDSGSGAVKFEKVLSTSPHFADGVHQSLAKAGVDVAQALHFVHGSTVAVNAVIQKTGARTALVTTEGFEDVYEIGRANRPDTYNLFFEKPRPLVPATLRFGVRERMNATGAVVRPLDLASARRAIRKLRAAKVDAVAVCLLHAYANPAHEIALGEMLRKALPDVYITLAHEILREYREYERTSTAVLNCYVGPEVSRYLKRIDDPLRQQSFTGTFYIMQSNGGVMTAARARQSPVSMMESGPAGGIIGAAVLGKALGENNVIAFDMGGTTAKACLVERGLPRMADQYYVGGYREGYPMRLPVLDITEVGAGGGSIAWIDRGGALKVGPRSAGAVPGPVCYGRGGTEPTVTDGNLVIGRLNRSRFLGGEMNLDQDAAVQAITRVVARPFDMSPIEAAYGILKIADARMSALVRAITLQRGYDPRDFSMIAFGGGGPLHATAIARELNIPRVIIPPQPGHFSALGMLLTDLRHDFVQTRVVDLDAIDAASLADSFAPLEESGQRVLAEQGCDPTDTLLLRSVDMRYLGQEYTVSVSLSARLDADEMKALRRRFDAAYDQRYGHSDPEVPAQIVTLRLAAIGTVAKPEIATLRGPAEYSTREIERRNVYFETAGKSVDSPVVQRGSLLVDQAFEGPVIIEEHASTTVVQPGDRVRVERNGCLVIDIGADREGAVRT